MQIATIQHKKISGKQVKTFLIVTIVILVLAIAIGGFFMIQGGISSQASEEAPLNVNIQSIDAGKTSVSWETGKNTIGVVEYGKSTDPQSFTEFAFSENESMSHAVTISPLESNTTYYFQIRIGDQVFNNGGSYWSFKTPAGDSSSITPTQTPTITEPSQTITPSISETLSPSPSTSITTSPSVTLAITPTTSGSPTPTATISATLTPTPTTASSICLSNNCSTILQSLGKQCRTQDYVRCLLGVNVTITQAVTKTPTPTPLDASIKSTCAINSFQANSCTSWIWEDMLTKEQKCQDVFTQYFVQCKGTSWSSNDSAYWYCNERVTSNQLTIPCANAPTPAPGQSIFCRVRAEGANGGDANATSWIYTNSSCSTYSSLSGVQNCQVNYLQQNLCGSWNWSLKNPNDPQCLSALDHYFLQCTSNGLFSAPAALTPTPYWYCNTTTTSRYLDMPCDNSLAPADGAAITCRVRPEDAYSTDAHAGDWVTTSVICPTSTPTPTPEPT